MNPDSAQSQSVFAAAIQWLNATLLGSIATAIAVIAVGSVGFLTVSGRIDLRRAAQVIFGCFILFGASSIAGGIAHLTDRGDAPSPLNPEPPSAPLNSGAPHATVTPVKSIPYDPYAGAALPTRQ